MVKRIVSEQEQALWREVTRHDKKLHSKEAEDAPEIVAVQDETHMPATIAMRPVVKAATALNVAPLRFDKISGVDGNTARKLKRGTLPIERALDLHGVNRATAYALLHEHIIRWSRAHVRVCAIITGKGRGAEGVLKQALPHWLNDEALRPYIITACYAPAHYGGNGAVLLILRKQ